MEWVNQRLNIRLQFDQCRTLTAFDAGILAVVVYSTFSENHCEMTIASASPRWCTRRFLHAAFAYPFLQCGYQRVNFVTTPDNHSTLSLLDRLGAVREATLKNWFLEGDGILYRMLREECKWIDRIR